MNHRTLILIGTLILSLVSALCANDWITAPSYYTHDPQTGERVRQYTPIGPFYTYADSTYRRSGYRHTRSTLQVGQSADNLHIVEQWGDPVRPYGEWRFPNRPYSVPFPLWNSPYAGSWPGYGYGSGYGSGYGQGYPGNGPPPRRSGSATGWYGQSPQPYPGGVPGGGYPRALQDGSYAPYEKPRMPDRRFFWKPGDPSRHTPPPSGESE